MTPFPYIFSMPYTECVTLEIMRYTALVPLAVLHSTTEDVVVEGYRIPKNTLVMPNLYAAMHDPVWGDPENFRPERFLLSDGTVNRHHEAHMVFSTGKRACLGTSNSQKWCLCHRLRFFLIESKNN